MNALRPLLAAAALSAAIVFACSSPNPVPNPTPPLVDAGLADGGADGGADAGEEDDAGVTDAGDESDAGTDGGSNTNTDAGTDAGMEPADAGCFADAGAGLPPNLLFNPGFECGVDGWSTQNNGATLAVETTDSHSGTRSAQLTATSAGTSLLLFPATEPVEMPGVGRFCASAWVKGPPGEDARLEIIGPATSTKANAPFTNGWMQIEVDALSLALTPSITVRVGMENPGAGDTVLVDDVDLFRTNQGNCPTR